MEITSSKNPKIKQIKSLYRRKKQMEYGTIYNRRSKNSRGMYRQ